MGRLAYFEWSTEDPGPGVDPTDNPEVWAEWAGAERRWADANPAYGIRITAEAVETELKSLEPNDFARERLGVFADQLDSVESVIPEEDWAACEDKSSTLVDPIVLAFDVSVDRRWGVIAAAGRSSVDGMLHVEVVEHRRFTGWMVKRLEELVEAHSPAAVAVFQGGPAGALIADCDKAEVELKKAGGADVAQACGAAFDEIMEHRWRHIGQPVLTLAVSESARRAVGDTWVFDRRGAADISALSAVTLAAWAARTLIEKASVYEERGLLIL